tara:strand:- start:2799 stop:3677 length:879 start_codon:yes stop_codon:yes gene_type:complete
MAINPNQISVAKIYPGNYANVLRYWHEEKTMQFENANGVSSSYTNQPVGGPVGVIFRPGWVAQQAIGYVDLSYQALGSVNQLEYYTQAYGSGVNSSPNGNSNVAFSDAAVIIPSPDFHKDVRQDIADGIQVPSGVYCYRASLRITGGDVVSSGIPGSEAAPTLSLAPAVGEGYPNDNTVVSGGFAVSAIGANRRIPNGSVASTNIIDSSLLEATTAETQWKLFATTNASPVVQGSGVYDPRAGNNFLSGDEKALAICEVCWILPDSPPERQDVALQPDGVTESSVYTSTQPR